MSQLLAGFHGKSLAMPRELIGHGWMSRPCTGVNDPLMVECLVLDDGTTRVVIITLDLLAVDSVEADKIRGEVASLGVQPENVFVGALHTHSGPPAIDFGHVKKSEELATEVVGTAGETAMQAFRELSPASVRSGFTEFPHNVNRRQPTLFKRTKLGVNLSGPVDHRLSYLFVETSRGKVLLLCYGCHPVINKKLSVASADYLSGVRQLAASAGIAGTLFLNGALGDVNPYDREKRVPLGGTNAEIALEYGTRMAKAALGSLSTQSQQSDQRMGAASATIEACLPRMDGGVTSQRLLVQVLKAGQLVLAAFPAEIFAQSSLDLRRRFPGVNLATVSCANGYIGYAPPKNEYARRGYEVDYAPRVLGHSVMPGVAEDLQAQAERLIPRVLYSSA